MATALALIALFVSLDGPATAARLVDGGTLRPNSVTTAQIRNGSLGTHDLSARAIRSLTTTPPRSVGSRELAAGAVDAAKLAAGAVTTRALGDQAVGTPQLADGAVTAAQLAAGAVTPSRVADGAIGGAAIADGALTTSDVGDIYGTVAVDFKPFRLNECQTVRVDAPQSTSAQAAQIVDDLILVSPAAAGFSDLLSLAAYPGAGNTVRIVACRVGRDAKDPDNPDNLLDPPPVVLQYLGIDAP